jgi:hypothetical protein
MSIFLSLFACLEKYLIVLMYINHKSSFVMDENTKIFPGGAVTPIREVWAERTAGPIHIMGPGTVGDFMIIKQSPMCWLEEKILQKIGHPLYRTFPVGTSSRCPGTMAGLYRGRMSCDACAPWREATRWDRSRHRST